MHSSIEIEEILLDQEKEQEIEKPLKTKRLLWFYVIISVCLLILLTKTAYLQIVQGKNYQKIAENNRVQIEAMPALRGIIYDQHGKQLVKNTTNGRQYKNSHVLSHVLGYTNSENIGQAGLELIYEDYLHGTDGKKRIEVDAVGKNKRVIAIKEPEAGYNLILNIDASLQNKLYELLPNTPSVAIALDAQTGGVLALVSKPSFDNNLFSQGITTENYKSLINNPSKPLFNRAISGQYPPGSTIKPMLALAALQENLVNPLQKIDDVPYLRFQNPYNSDVVYTFPDWKDHGRVNMIKAIQESCNIYFYKIGEKLGWKNIKKYGQFFGLDKKLGIDLPNESTGYLPDKGWLGDLYHASIGQGDMTITVLQLAVYTAAIANKGRIYQPQIVDKIVDNSDNLIKDILPKIIKSGFIDLKNFEIVQEAMKYGKTGTAQFTSNKSKYHAWYTSYQDNLVISVLVEEGGSGQQTALPVAKSAYKWYLNKDADY